jgi:ComF family protein
MVIPIPLHRFRLFNRGFNQAVFLLNKQKVLKLQTSILKKKKRTLQQAGKTRKERKANLKNAFQIVGDVKEKKVLLFDDVCTTGQTLAEASKVLKRAGAEQVDALVLCRSMQVI